MHGLQFSVRLPDNKINPFTGKFEDTFLQLYYILIFNDTSLTDIERFVYLKYFLRDGPLKIIEILHTTNESFEIALNLLKKRYVCH